MMKRERIRQSFVLLPAMALLMGLGGCFSSSDDDGPTGLSEKDAAIAAMVAMGMAEGMDDYSEQAGMDGAQTLRGGATASSNECSGTGHLYITEGSVDGASLGMDTAFGYTGSMELMEMDADCVLSQDSYYVESRGYMRFAHSPDDTVVYGEMTPGVGQSADAGPFISIMNMGSMSMEQESRMYMHMCLGCPSLGGGLNAEMQLFADIQLEYQMPDEPDMDFRLRWGKSSSDRMTMEVTDLGGATAQYLMNGFMGFESDSQGCGFAADFTTVQPLVVENANTMQPMAVSGELHMTPEGGGATVEAVYNSDGSVTVNGTTFTQEELGELIEDCSVEM